MFNLVSHWYTLLAHRVSDFAAVMIGTTIVVIGVATVVLFDMVWQTDYMKIARSPLTMKK